MTTAAMFIVFMGMGWTVELDNVGSGAVSLTPDHLFLDSAPNIGPLISRWELDN